MVRAIATPETMMQLDVSVARGLSIFRGTDWAALDECEGLSGVVEGS